MKFLTRKNKNQKNGKMDATSNSSLNIDKKYRYERIFFPLIPLYYIANTK